MCRIRRSGTYKEKREGEEGQEEGGRRKDREERRWRERVRRTKIVSGNDDYTELFRISFDYGIKRT